MTDVPPSPTNKVALVLKPLQDSEHIAIVYRDEEALKPTWRLIHLFGDRQLRRESFDRGRWRVWVSPSVAEDVVPVIIARCHTLGLSTVTGLRFGLGSPFDCFDPLSAEMLPAHSGLTCATFVEAVFYLAGIVLIDRTGWPSRVGDTSFQLKVVTDFQSGGIDHAHILANKTRVGSPRCRPSEIAAASTLIPPPAQFATLRPVADRIVEMLLQ